MTYPVGAQTPGRDRVVEPEQALRRVATLVAEGIAPAELFAAVVEEVGRVLARPAVVLDRYEPDGTTTVLAATNVPGFPTGSRWPLDDGPSLARTILETGRAARIDDYASLDGTIAGAIRAGGFHSAVGVPVVVEGAVWGLLCVGTTGDDPLGTGAEQLIRDFTELVAIAVSNAESRDRLRRLAEQQTSLRRVATLVAESATPAELFAAVAEEVARIADASLVTIARYADRTAVVVASLDAADFRVGSCWPLDGPSLFATVFATGRPARIDDYSELPGPVAAAARASGLQSGLGLPIVVDGSVWGMVAVGRRQRRDALPTFTGSYTSRLVFSTESTADVEARLTAFTDLVATAISNAAAREELVASRARIVAAGDEARRRFERNLHDGTQQRLLALRLDLQRIRAAIPESDQATRSGLEQAESDLESVLEEVREVSRGLHPAGLARGGLGPSLRTLAARSPIDTEVDVQLEARPPQQIETAVYYVVSEALANAIKHSGAARIRVVVIGDRSALQASVADDGIGGAAPEAGSGLTGLNDRVEALGGRLAFASPSGAGTTISIELPLSTPAAP